MDNSARRVIDWAFAAHTMPGETESGDKCWVRQNSVGAWVAVIDGAGHGHDAARASAIAIAVLEQSAEEPPADVLRQCHEALRLTRGVVMSFAEFSARDCSLTWLGVGNVEGVVFRRNPVGPASREVLLPRPGVLGVRMPNLSPAVLSLAAGDTLVFATDGVRPGFAEHVNRRESPQQIADSILDEYGRQTDDALVLVARYLNGNNHSASR